MRRRVEVLSFIFTLLLLAGVAGHILPVQSQLNPGDILVIDADAGTGGFGALFRVDSTAGARILLSDFGDGGQGPTGVDPFGVAVEASGNILVTDFSAGTGNLGALFRVNPTTGARTLLSDFGDGGQGPTGVNPFGVAVEASGNILVADINAGTGNLGALFRVNPTTGARTLLSDFGDAGQGPTGFLPAGVAVEASGNILVTDYLAGTGSLGALFRVNPTTGARTLLSDFGDAGQGPTGASPFDVAVEASGNILVIDVDAGTGGVGALFRVNPTTGARTLLSDFGDAGQGPTGSAPAGVAVEASGNILVTDFSAGTGNLGALFRVNPTTGARTLLSDFGDGAPLGGNPYGVAVYPVISAPVGGVIVQKNSLEILTPYLALAALIMAVSTVYVMKKRKE